jgi:hypothetical protein
MEIRIGRGGGPDGRTEGLGPVNTEGLPQETARQIGDIITKMDFFDLPTTIAKPGGADVIEYKTIVETTVGDHGRTHIVCSNDLSDTTYRQQLSDLTKLLEESGAKFVPYEAGPFFTAGGSLAARYDLTGDGVTIKYLPNASLSKGERLLGYSDGQRSLDFYGKDARRVQVPDLGGSCVSVTLADTAAGSITATLLVPDVSFSGHDTAWSFPVESVLITVSPGPGRHTDSYEVTKLIGEARESE